MMKPRTLILLLAGLALFTALIAWQGYREVAGTLTQVGWGIVPVALWHVVPMGLDATGWYCVLPPGRRPPWRELVRLRWLAESINGLLPVAQMGGEFVRTRLVMRRGVPGRKAGASVVVDLTLGFATQLLFALAGIGLLAARSDSVELARTLAFAVSVALAGMGGFYAAQRIGLFRRLAQVVGHVAGDRKWLDLVGGAQALDTAIGALWIRYRAVLRCAAWRTAGWLAGSGEIWLTLYFLGHPVTWGEAMIVESIAQVARSAGFAIPGALGVQEGGYLLAGRALGLSSEVSLAVALVRRARELLLGVPGLIAWQWGEGRHHLARNGAARETNAEPLPAADAGSEPHG